MQGLLPWITILPWSICDKESMHICIAFWSQATTHAVYPCQSSFLTDDLRYQHNLSFPMLTHPWLDPDHPCQLADSWCGSWHPIPGGIFVSDHILHLFSSFLSKTHVWECFDCCLQGIQPCKWKGNGHQWLGNQVFRLAEEEKKKRISEISGRDLQKPLGKFKTVNSLQDGKC